MLVGVEYVPKTFSREAITELKEVLDNLGLDNTIFSNIRVKPDATSLVEVLLFISKGSKKPQSAICGFNVNSDDAGSDVVKTISEKIENVWEERIYPITQKYPGEYSIILQE